MSILIDFFPNVSPKEHNETNILMLDELIKKEMQMFPSLKIFLKMSNT